MTELAAAIGPWVGIIALVLSIANTVNQWVSRPGRELKERVDNLGENTDAAIEVLEKTSYDRFKEHDRRIQKLEDGQPHQPTKEDLHALSLKMAELGTKMEGLAHTVDRMDRHLREPGK